MDDTSLHEKAKEQLSLIYLKRDESIYTFNTRFKELLSQALITPISDLATFNFKRALPLYLLDKIIYLESIGNLKENTDQYSQSISNYESGLNIARKEGSTSAFHTNDNNYNKKRTFSSRNEYNNNYSKKWCNNHNSTTHDTSECRWKNKRVFIKEDKGQSKKPEHLKTYNNNNTNNNNHNNKSFNIIKIKDSHCCTLPKSNALTKRLFLKVINFQILGTIKLIML